MSTHAHDDPQAPPAPVRRHPAGVLLVAAMAVGSVVMWLVVPVAWLWLGSHMTSSTQPSIGPYLLVLAGTVVSMVAIGKGLGALNRLHMRVTGRLRDRRAQAAWMKSMRGERRGVHDDRGVLDGVMLTSVGIALVLFGIWFFAFAGSSLPG
ncbi:hypothetical protein [Baekduia soli]|uniref:hypothetical protein n=1 Tax=Baekduia soli TaxID=496014 RepID=UPI001651F9A3|nr:hypothetical protein [Baekduia soli]